MTTDKSFLQNAYGLHGAEQTTRYYDEWAATYEAELAANGYVTPGRCADALLALDPRARGPVLDLGCGTGLAGLALRARGFQPIDGMDFSPGMLEVARAHGCYRALDPGDLTKSLDRDDAYAHAVAAGVFSPGHAPASSIRNGLAPVVAGGVMAFSLNDHALEDPSFDAEIASLVECGAAEIAFSGYGPHIPATGLQARVIALRKL